MKQNWQVWVSFLCFFLAMGITGLYSVFGEVISRCLMALFFCSVGLGWYFMSKWFLLVRKSKITARLMMVIAGVFFVLAVMIPFTALRALL